MGTEDELEHSGYSTTEEETTNVETTSALALVSTEVLTADTNSTHTNESPGLQEFVLMVAVPLAALVILLSVVLLVVYLKSRRHKQEPPSQGSQSVFQTYEPIGENLKVPIFEEDTPSVMEIEMEELDRWMSSKNRNGTWRPECLVMSPSGDGRLAGCLGFGSSSGILKPRSIGHRSEWS
ncbi:hypothetical protein U0070_003016 [Myodes glareolus]|uniref:Transmembrane protein 154 n=1 Tax=Myodes glareolus TaxID=447135 RepID=A0AAW0HSM0_MYOGA